MIRGIGEKGGVMGVNYFTEFLRDKEKFGDPMKTSLDDMVAHIRRIIRVGGIDSVGLGSDFDGAAVSMEITNAGDMQLLAARLEKDGFSTEEIEKIFYKTVFRVYREILK